LLLVGGRYLLVEAAKVLVFLGLEDGEGTGQLAGNGDLAWIGLRLDDKGRMTLPGGFSILRSAFHSEVSGQMIDDLVGDQLAIVHINGFQPSFLIDKGMVSSGLEEEARKQETFGGRGAENALHLDDGHQVYVRIVEGKKVIDVGLYALWSHGPEPVVEALFDFVFVVFQGRLPPEEGFLAGHDKAEAAGDGAAIVEGNIPGAEKGVRRVG